jgi:hypothetical protein
MSKARKERWRPIPGYERYYVSECGRVWDFHRKKLMEFTITDRKYLTVRLPTYGDPKIRKTMKVHRLVMKAFTGESSLPVNHKDKNRQNNHLGNLEYLTTGENNYHKHVTISSPIEKTVCHLCHQA